MPAKKKPFFKNKKRKKAPTKKDVVAIVKKTINNKAEKKFMAVSIHKGLTPNVSRIGGSSVSVLGFMNTINKVGSGLTQVELDYGIEDQSVPAGTEVFVAMKQLKMLRPFTSTTATQQTQNYAIEGRECMPVSASCKWRLTRDIGKLTTGLEGANWNSNLGAPNGLQYNLPIVCRMIRVVPILTQTNQVCDPGEDLFLTPYNNAIGVHTSVFDDTELMTYRVNRRRYKVLQDTKFTIRNGLTVQYQRAVQIEPATSDGAMLQPIISNTNANCERVMNTSHQLTTTKGKPVFYDIPESQVVETATAGARREMILYHFQYQGAKTYLSNAGVVNKAPTDITIDAVPLVKFTDI